MQKIGMESAGHGLQDAHENQGNALFDRIKKSIF
jgi:hypothetical protein